jgi:pyridoxal phosphate enzyme (YggS family)
MVDVAANLEAVRRRVEAACLRVGRSPSSVRLVAVSKLQPVERIVAAYEAGQRDFGENYAQELRDKAAALVHLSELRWHAIGALQSNKAGMVAKVAHAFHALDRLEIGRALGRRREVPLDCFVEVNVAEEASKQGVAPDEAGALLARLREVAGLRVVGLMGMPPMVGDDPNEARPWFARLRRLAGELGLPELSMGTTEDFEVAIEEGATVVRVGRSIFGERAAR